MVIRTLAAAALGLFCSGCAWLNNTETPVQEPTSEPVSSFWHDNFEDPANLAKIARGTSNRQEVRKLLGEPHDITSLNGEEKWTYKSYRTVAMAYVPGSHAGGSMQTIEVSVLFDRQGVVKSLESQKQQW
jgi:outer membrane protein assembly factor BamE (lipoprotein component of BamABCDE complex)